MKKFGYIDIRNKFLSRLESKGHAIIPSASLVPENDPSLLFVNSGMFPLVPFLLGETHPKGTRLTNSQRCLRTGDIEEVGDNIHCTTFEMLGNWSLNDYFKEEAIRTYVDFLTKDLGFDIKTIYATVFKGDQDAPVDQESIDIWKKIYKESGIDAEVGDRIQLYGKEANWWELEAGGPCGPCAEFFFDTGKEACGKDCHINCNCGKFVEIGNDVFMQYLKKDGNYTPLGRHNVDFGGGLDRIVMINQGVESFYESDIYKPIFDKVKELSKNDVSKSQRVITDHIKAATWIINDGVVPGRTQQSYLLRRLIRRAVRHSKILGIERLFTKEVGDIAITQFLPIIPELEKNRENILNVLQEEEVKFNQTLENGLKEFEKMFKDVKNFDNSSGETFKLYETYGFPLEITLEELTNRDVKYDEKVVKENHEKSYTSHQDRSRSASKGLFKGGLADTSEMSTKYHTATHLLLASLYKVLGSHIYQKGSNITTERLRLDFPNESKLTDEQIEKIEKLVQEQIDAGLPVTWKEMSKDEALKVVKYAAFEDKYGDTVKVYTIGTPENPFSQEICGGPHVENTSTLGKFKIVKQENVGAGIKRVKATLE